MDGIPDRPPPEFPLPVRARGSGAAEMAEQAAEEYPASPKSTADADGRISSESSSSGEATQLERTSAGESAQNERHMSDGEAVQSSTDEKDESPGPNSQFERRSADEGAGADKPSAGETSAGASGGEEGGSETAPQGESEEQEEEECGFCLFMKGGPCGKRFTSWQECVEGAEKSDKDIVQQCAQMTTLLRVCMEMNPEYYGPVLEAEKAMEAEVNSMEQNPESSGKSKEAEVKSEESVSETVGIPPESSGKSKDAEGKSEEIVSETVGIPPESSGKLKEAEGKSEESVSETVGIPAESPAGGGEEAASGAPEEVRIRAVEKMDIVLDDEGQVKEVVDQVEVKEAVG